MTNLRIKVGLGGVLSCVVVVLFLQKFVVNLIEYFTQLAVGVTLIAIGIGYWTFKPEIERLTSKIAIQETEENKKHAENHRKKVFEDYQIAINNRALAWQGYRLFFRDYHNSRILLQHFFTGHSELYSTLLSNFEIDKQIREAPNAPSKEIKEKMDKADADVREKLGNLVRQIKNETSELKGICGDCLRFYEKDPTYNKIKSQLDSFAMPF
ncbi:MAG: hypothetical protein HY222_03125 [Thaumarchaeota archaeon]|nr:hypothetical protein [Nitrososphaerota archaeon]